MSLISRQCNEIISTSTKLMDRFTLEIFHNYFNRCPQLSRHYRKIIINGISKYEYQDIYKLMQQIGAKASFVSIEFCEIPRNNCFLSCFPNVATLRICGDIGSSEIFDESVFSKLKFLCLDKPSSVSVEEQIFCNLN